MAGEVQGIQHLGIGVDNHEKTWRWYRKFFGLDVPFFNQEALAPLMSTYTNGEVINKRAAMVLNLKGGCAIEIVQPTSFLTVESTHRPTLQLCLNRLDAVLSLSHYVLDPVVL